MPPCNTSNGQIGGFGITIPPFVKAELNNWIGYIQCKPGDSNHTAAKDGGSGYQHESGGGGPCNWVNILKTGNLLNEMAFVGDTKDTPRVVNATNYLVMHWADPNFSPGWKGAPNATANNHAMFSTMKGLVSLDIHELDGIDWQSDFEEVLLAQQNDDGSWPLCKWDDDKPILSTEWALLTLQKAAPKPPTPPPPVPRVPALSQRGMVIMAALFAALLAWTVRKRAFARKKVGTENR